MKRSSIKFLKSPQYLCCTKCDFAAKSRAVFVKHKKSHQAQNSSSSLELPIHQSTRNNSLSEGLGLLNDHVTLEETREIEVEDEVAKLPIEDKSENFKYTCMD